MTVSKFSALCGIPLQCPHKRNSYQIAAKQFTPVYNEIKAIATGVKRLEDMNGAPYTPGPMPEWKGNR